MFAFRLPSLDVHLNADAMWTSDPAKAFFLMRTLKHERPINEPTRAMLSACLNQTARIVDNHEKVRP